MCFTICGKVKADTKENGDWKGIVYYVYYWRVAQWLIRTLQSTTTLQCQITCIFSYPANVEGTSTESFHQTIICFSLCRTFLLVLIWSFQKSLVTAFLLRNHRGSTLVGRFGIVIRKRQKIIGQNGPHLIRISNIIVKTENTCFSYGLQKVSAFPTAQYRNDQITSTSPYMKSFRTC